MCGREGYTSAAELVLPEKEAPGAAGRCLTLLAQVVPGSGCREGKRAEKGLYIGMPKQTAVEQRAVWDILPDHII